MDSYDHRQIRPWPLFALGLFALLRGKARRRAWPLLGFGLLTIQFSMLNTHVDEHGASWRRNSTHHDDSFGKFGD